MKVIQAAKETMDLWKMRNGFIEKPTELSFTHCQEMLTKMTTENFSYGKLCRWLGWMQAACVANGCATLEEMKEINRRNSADGWQVP